MNLSRLLKSLLPSFVPLLVYVAADALFGEKIGLLVGVGVGIVEFVVTFIKDRKPDPFVAVDTLLLAAAGAVSLASGNDIFFKLKPAVIELVFTASFALLLVLPPRYLKAYMERQLRGFEFSEEAMAPMRKNLGFMLGILVAHAVLTVYAALRLSTAAWGFISGVLLYIAFGAIALGEFAFVAVKKRKLRGELGAGRGEKILPIIDEAGKVTGQAPERICHALAAGAAGPEGTATSSLLHPALRLYIVDNEGRLYLRKKPQGPGLPELWDAALERHVEAGENLDAAVAAGLREGLGLTPMALEAAHVQPQLALRYRRDEENESELVFVFFLQYEGPFALDAAGGSEGCFFGGEGIRAEIGSGTVSPRFLKENELLARAQAEARGANR
jgi:intracellular septation protein A/isopentenyldiphosphate isomerase